MGGNIIGPSKGQIEVIDTNVDQIETLVNTIDGKVDTVDGIVDDITIDTSKIDDVTVDGLAGTADSLAYKVHEIEKHHHNAEKWYGLAGTPAAETHRMDRITLLVEPFQADAGNNTWGSWLQVIGSSDTPEVAGNAYIDLHRIIIVSHEHNNNVYALQFVCGESAAIAAKITAEDFTETMMVSGGGNTETGPVTIKGRRLAVGEKCWIRIWAKGRNTGTLDFYIGIHEYPG